MSADRQWILMQTGDFDGAKQVDFQEVSPQFDLMQHQVQIAIEAEDNWAQGVDLQAGRRELARSDSRAPICVAWANRGTQELSLEGARASHSATRSPT
jgi:hypothetical protein